ncbi:aspartic peptidase domain-containing protein [Cristinia sonorae]|uniref:Aspartic peptidase domain-containing protein n=1 Tax=Cristinia sonorae TaxID=1940300 RepID=A0A8K0XRQ7_9AGAR|nr:aspartic peptidase domain-containing protein [Cristinia sonorae]
MGSTCRFITVLLVAAIDFARAASPSASYFLSPFQSSLTISWGVAWVSLNVSVPSVLADGDYPFSYVDVLVGTPPQLLSLPIDMQADIITAYWDGCPFCPGTTFYNPIQSLSAKDPSKPLNGTAQIGGNWMSDTIGLNGVVQADDISIAMIKLLSTQYPGTRPLNGGFGFLDGLPRNVSVRKFIPDLYASGKLLNPVVGMRLDPLNPRLSIGVLDPNDYNGEINWVQLEPNVFGDNLYNQFKVDGIVGRNGSLVPYGDNLLGGINSMAAGIVVPDNFTWSGKENFTGPLFNHTMNIDPGSGLVSIPCNDSKVVWGEGVHVPPPYVDFTVQINGVKYMVDSHEIVRDPNVSLFPEGFCNLDVVTNTVKGKPDFWLGLPFLRSVYLAYRLPTGDCPGYYGFAFPRGANRTEEQISQKPTSTPAQMSQCLRFTAPTSTPTLVAPKKDEGTLERIGNPEFWLAPINPGPTAPNLSERSTAPPATRPITTQDLACGAGSQLISDMPEHHQKSGAAIFLGCQYALLYDVYGRDGLQVPLKGVEFLKKGVWNITA